MGDSLYDLLLPHFENPVSTLTPSPTAFNYLSHLTTLSLSALSDEEPRSLAQSANSNLLSLKGLSTRCHKSVIAASDALATLSEQLPALTSSAAKLRNGVPALDESALGFAQKYSKSYTQKKILDRRKEAMLLSRNVDRVSDILELPSLLATAIASPVSTSGASGLSGSGTSGINYSQALDLYVHIKRLQILHPDSSIIESVLAEAEEAMKDMTSNLITSLRGQNVRLAASIRSIGWLRRVAPELATPGLPQLYPQGLPGSPYGMSLSPGSTPSEGSFGYLFLTCRLCNLLHMLEALAPLRDLADYETQQKLQRQKSLGSTSGVASTNPLRNTVQDHSRPPSTGHQTERYLKRYIEIFREQSFAIVSIYKNVFPATSSEENHITSSATTTASQTQPTFLHLPASLSTFSSHLVSLLTQTLIVYLPNLSDLSARDSILMQVLYAAGSFGRLGADFAVVILPTLFPEDNGSDDSEDGEDSHEEQIERADDVEKQTDPEDRSANLKSPNVSNTIDASSSKKQQIVTPKIDTKQIPEYIRILQKHRLQASKLEALSASSSSSPSQTPASRTAKEEATREKG